MIKRRGIPLKSYIVSDWAESHNEHKELCFDFLQYKAIEKLTGISLILISL